MSGHTNREDASPLPLPRLAPEPHPAAVEVIELLDDERWAPPFKARLASALTAAIVASWRARIDCGGDARRHAPARRQAVKAALARAEAAATLASKATPGPWRAEGDSCVTGHATNWEAEVTGEGIHTSRDDAAFIAAARETVPALIADVRALAAEVERLRGIVDRCIHPSGDVPW